MGTFFFYFTIVLFIFVSVLLILLILVQKGRGGGLSGAFGGAGGNTAFGAKTGDVLTWATSIMFGVFVLLAVALNLFANYRHEHPSNALSSSITTPASSSPGAGATPVEGNPSTNPAQ